jgi:hypothetical protein
MSELRQRTNFRTPRCFARRAIRACLSRAGVLALLMSVASCQSPGPASQPVNDSAAQAKEQAAVEAFSAKELEPEVSLRSAADILPETLLTGLYHTVRNEVVARGFVHYYVIESPYGEFLAAGDDEVRQRIREITAVADLRRLSKTEVITDSATDAAKRSYVAAKEVIDKPWETAKAIPSGLERLFKRSKRQAEDAYDNVNEWYQGEDSGSASGQSEDAQAANEGLTKAKLRDAADLGIDEGQNYLKGSLGFNRELRRLAQRLGVDPYTRNAVLRNEMASMAWTATAGSFAINLIMPDVPAPIGLLKNTQELVWNTNAIDLLLRNEEIVRHMGIDSAISVLFFDNEFYTLSDQTRLVQAMERLQGAENIDRILSKAAQVESREESRFYVRSAELLALYHEHRAPVEKLIEDEHGPLTASDKDGRLIVALPLDYLNWSRSAHDIAMAMYDSLKPFSDSDASEVWIEGIVSSRALQVLSQLGWTVNERAFEKLTMDDQSAG